MSSDAALPSTPYMRCWACYIGSMSLSLSLCFLCGPWKGYDLFMEDIPKKTIENIEIEMQEVLSTPVNNHLWGGSFIFCVHPYLLRK